MMDSRKLCCSMELHFAVMLINRMSCIQRLAQQYDLLERMWKQPEKSGGQERRKVAATLSDETLAHDTGYKLFETK